MRLQVPSNLLSRLIGLLLLFLGLYLVYLVRVILPPFIIALIIAYLLNPLVETIESLKIPRVVAILVVYMTVVTVVSLVVFYGVPKVLRELNHFADAIPIYTEQVQDYIKIAHRDYSKTNIPESIRQVTDETIKEAEELLISTVRNIADAILGLFSQLLSLVIAPILSFYVLKDWDIMGRYMFSLFPTGWREEAAYLFHQMDLVLTKFIRGHLLVVFIVGSLTAIGLTLIGVKFALLLGILAGIADIIPYFGPIIGAVPAIAIALLHSKYQALYAAGVMLLVQQLESNIISPKILGDSVGLHPLVIIFALLAGGQLFGIIGMLLAVPATAVVRILLSYFFSRWFGYMER